MSCSSGTYVRAVARDLGRALGTGAYLTALRRTRIGRWSVADALPPARLAETALPDSAVLELSDALDFLPAVSVSDSDVQKLVHGQALTIADLPDGDIVRALAGGKLVALLRRTGEQLRPHKVLATVE